MNLKVQIILLFLFVLLSSCSEDSVSTTVEKNNPPKITSLTSQSDIVDGLASVQLVCLASDPDGDKLEYIWEYDKGKLEGTGNVVYWTAPNTLGNNKIICTVDDKKGGIAKDTVNVSVGQISILPLEITELRVNNLGKIIIGSNVEIKSETNKPSFDNLRYYWQVYGGTYNTVQKSENLFKISPLDENAYVVSEIVINDKNEIDVKATNFFVGDTIIRNNYVKVMQFTASKNSYTSLDTIVLNFYAVTSDNSPINYEINITGYGNTGRFGSTYSTDNAVDPFVLKDLNRFVNEDRYNLVFICCAFDNKKNSDIMIINSILEK